jgi:hypothetical protein
MPAPLRLQPGLVFGGRLFSLFNTLFSLFNTMIRPAAGSSLSYYFTTDPHAAKGGTIENENGYAGNSYP